VEKANTLCNSGYFRPFVGIFQVNALAGRIGVMSDMALFQAALL